MRKNLFDLSELKIIGIVFIVSVVLFKIAFFNESFLGTVKIVLAIFWLFVLPGYFALSYWKEKLQLIERLVVGITFSAAILGIVSYYLGLIGIHTSLHHIIIPLLIIVAGSLHIFKK